MSNKILELLSITPSSDKCLVLDLREESDSSSFYSSLKGAAGNCYWPHVCNIYFETLKDRSPDGSSRWSFPVSFLPPRPPLPKPRPPRSPPRPRPLPPRKPPEKTEIEIGYCTFSMIQAIYIIFPHMRKCTCSPQCNWLQRMMVED